MTTVATGDLLSLDEYARVRPDYRRRIIEMKNRRRVMIGAHISLLFESRETILYQIQEMIWVERMTNSARIAQEIAEYERLVPRAQELTATLMVHGGSWEAGRMLLDGLMMQKSAVFLRIGHRVIPAETLLPFGDADCPVQYLRFPLDANAVDMLAHRRADVFLGATYAGRLEIVPLSPETVNELALESRASRVRRANGPRLQTETNIPQKESK